MLNTLLNGRPYLIVNRVEVWLFGCQKSSGRKSGFFLHSCLTVSQARHAGVLSCWDAFKWHKGVLTCDLFAVANLLVQILASHFYWILLLITTDGPTPLYLRLYGDKADIFSESRGYRRVLALNFFSNNSPALTHSVTRRCYARK